MSTDRFANRFQVIRILGEGSMGRVLLVREPSPTGTGSRPLALKMVSPGVLASERVDRLKDEFRVLSGLRHPHLARVYEFGYSPVEAVHYFTTEFVEGEDLLAACKGCAFSEIATLVGQILRALEYLHERGIFPRDVKPENVLVREPRTPRAHVVLVDFGLAGDVRGGAWSASGTPAYMAPEVRDGAASDARSDLFAVGMLLHEALFGAQKTRQAPGPVSEAEAKALRADLPAAFLGFLGRLTDPDPERRFESAREALARLSSIAHLSLADETSETKEGYILSAGMVGREEQIRRLLELFRSLGCRPTRASDSETESLASSVVLVTGEAGVGKTRLLDEFRILVQLKGGLFARASAGEERGIGGDAAIRLVRETASLLAVDPPPLKLEEDRHIKGSLGVETPSTPLVRIRLFEAWTHFLIEAARERPLVLFLDDLHAADVATLEFAVYLARNVAIQALPSPAASTPRPGVSEDIPSPPASGAPRLLFVVAARTEELEPASAAVLARIQSGGRASELKLEPLDRSQVGRLLAGMMRQKAVPEPFRDRLFSLTAGNPFFLTEVMRRLVSDISIPTTGGALEPDLTALFTLEIPESLDHVLESRLSKLSPADARAASVLALLTRPEPAAFLERCLGLEIPDLSLRLSSLVRQSFLVGAGAPGPTPTTTFRFASDLLRQAAARRLGDEERRRLHRQIADAYRRTDPAASETHVVEIAHHLLRAQRDARLDEEAYSLSLEAARHARRVFAHEAALGLLQEALALLASGRPARSADARRREESRIRQEMGDLFKLLGHVDRAHDEYRAALECASDLDLVADVHLRMARLELERGRPKEARAEVEAALGALSSDDRTRRASASAILSRIALARGSFERARRWAVRGLHLIRDVAEDGMPLKRRELRKLAADALHAKGGYHQAIELLELNRAEEEAAGDVAGAATSENVIGNNWLRLGDYAKAEACYLRSLDRRESIGDVAGIAACHNNLGIIARYRNDYQAAIESYKRAAALGEKAGDLPALANTYNNLANVYFVLSKYDRATDYYRKSLALFVQLQDPNGRARVRNNLGGVLARRCLYSEALGQYRICLEIRRGLDSRARVAATLNNLGSVLLEIGDFGEAEAVLAEALSQARDEGLRYEQADSLRYLGRSALLRDKPDLAIQHLSTALELFREIGRRIEEAEAGLFHAEARFIRGDCEAGRIAVEAAMKAIPASAPTELGLRAEFLKLLHGFDDSGSAEGDRSERLDDLRRLLQRAAKTSDQRLALRIRLLLGRLLMAPNDTEAAFSCFIKALEATEAIWSGLSELSHKECFLNLPEIRDLFRCIQGLESEMTASVIRASQPRPAGTPSRVSVSRGEGWTKSLFMEAKSSLYEIGRALDMSKERFDKNNAGLKRILEISQVMNSTYGLNKLFKLIVDRVIEITQAERGFVILVDESGLALDIKVAYDLSRRGEMRNVQSEVSHTIITQVIREKRPLIYHDAMNEASLGSQRSVVKLDLRSIMCVPLMHRTRLLGVIYVDNRTTAGQFTDSDLELLNIFANQAALALENSRLFEDLQNSLKNLKETQDQLVRSERLRALGEMAGGVAHDFNNLLSSILGRAQLLQRELPDEQVRKELQVIEKAALDGAGTIKRIQNFTRVRRDKDFSPLDMNALVEDVLDFCKIRLKDEAQAKGRPIDVVRELGEIPQVDGSPPELREVLTNILFNALDAMPEGGQLRITTHLDGQHVCVSIADSGVGMSDETKRRIFDPFYSTKGNRGTGLGMSIVYGIVQRHRGEIHVESELGKGSTITIRLPISAGVVSAGRSTVGGERLRDSAASILVVDDEQGICRLLTDILSRAGYQVSACTSGKDAVQVFKKNNFDIVLTDLGMPEMTGWEVAKEIRKSDPDIPIALITGWAVELDDEKVRQNGVDLVITKPFNVEDVLNLIVDGIEFGKQKKASSTTP